MSNHQETTKFSQLRLFKCCLFRIPPPPKTLGAQDECLLIGTLKLLKMVASLLERKTVSQVSTYSTNERDRQRETETERERETDRERQTETERDRQRERDRDTETHTHRKRDRDEQIDTHTHAVSSNHHGHNSTAELTRRKRDFHAFMLINGVDLILTMNKSKNEGYL